MHPLRLPSMGVVWQRLCASHVKPASPYLGLPSIQVGTRGSALLEAYRLSRVEGLSPTIQRGRVEYVHPIGAMGCLPSAGRQQICA